MMPAPVGGTEQPVIHRVFETHVAQCPDAVAIDSGGELISYGKANGCANRWARVLRDCEVGDESPVALLLEPSADYVIALLAILKAGGCYVPLDIRYPRARLMAILDDTQASVVVTTRDLVERIAGYLGRIVLLDDESVRFAAQDEGNLEMMTHPDNLAYAIHTSGSSGKPKGVMVRHRSVVRLVQKAGWVRLGPQEVIPLLTSICFDVSMFEIWGALLNGGRLVVEPDATTSLRALGRLVSEHGVTTMWLTAGLFHTVVDAEIEILSGVRQLLAGGEAPSAKHVRKLLDRFPGMRFINGYGPTEATIFAAAHTVLSTRETDRPIPIGEPVPGTYLRILDSRLQPVPDETPGQLFIGGTGLARGYLGQPRRTAEQFVPDPEGRDHGGRLYATGDRVVRHWDRSIEFLGRIDQQLKIRGFRIEPGEIEATIRRHPAVRDVVVVPNGDAPESRLLVAYPVLDPVRSRDPDETLTEVRSWLSDQVPKHLVPDVWRPLLRLPLASNGKVDRYALPDPFAD
jgi:amino acid adenylation domain-containing protein